MTVKMTELEFEEKYQIYSQTIFNIAYGYTKNVQDSEDIVQNVFVKLILNQKVFKTSNDEKYWLVRVCINECINFVKSTHKKKIVLNDEIVLSSPNHQEESSGEITYYVSLLPEKYKIPIILYYYDNFKVNEISEYLGISEAAVRKRLERARDIIKEKMEAKNGK